MDTDLRQQGTLHPYLQGPSHQKNLPQDIYHYQLQLQKHSLLEALLDY